MEQAHPSPHHAPLLQLWQEMEGTPWLVDHVCLERPGGYGSPAWERQGGASQFDDSNLHFEHASFLCCGNKIRYLLIKKGSVFFSYVRRGWGWKGFRLFPRLLHTTELQGAHRAIGTAAGRAEVKAASGVRCVSQLFQSRGRALGEEPVCSGSLCSSVLAGG